MAAMVYLQIEAGEQSRRIEIGSDPIQIGRLEGNALVLEDTLISRRHCLVSRGESGCTVQDLNSSNGTYVNGERIANAVLHSGDVLSIGRFQIRFINEDEPTVVRESPALELVAEESPGDLAADELDESDLVDDTPDLFQSANGAHETPDDLQTIQADDHEATLLRLAESLPDKSFQDFQIALVNARGQVAHAAASQQAVRAVDAQDAVRLLRLILLICFRTGASDIHVEPREQIVQVRIRVDGTMVDLVRLDKTIAARLLSMIKILSDIDIAQRSIVQEGHFSSRLPDRRVDYRVSLAPSLHGQKLVIRILDTRNAPLRADHLKLPADMYELLIRAAEMDSGVVLVCGPTGSGKTTTLYALLRSLDVGQRNVITIEDPVEIQLPGITQLPVNDEQGNTFANLLRSVLRQDPDVILVGEIRDPETAKIAMQASTTGHLVFSTLHTRDTIGTIFRLLDLGVEPYMLAQGINIVVAQRLIRQLCPHCKKPAHLSAAEIGRITAEIGDFQQAFTRRGCPRCMGTGFSGRRAVYEMLSSNDALRDAILHNRSIAAMREALASTGFRRLMHHGYRLVADGVTTLDEVEKAVGM